MSRDQSLKKMRRNHDSPSEETEGQVTHKKAKLDEDHPLSLEESTTTVDPSEKRPMSKKELRAERKKARRAAADPEFAVALEEAEKRAAAKEEERQEFRRILREERNQKKMRQQKKQNRERNAPGGNIEKGQKKEALGERKKAEMTVEPPPEVPDEDEVARKIVQEIKYGKSDSSGWTTLHLGVKYKDIVVGNGPVVPNKSLVTVKYQLTGGKFGAVIDSSKNFKFRLGKGEVVQGWDIGVQGMREGGRRKLIVPPKAGYGSQDIGAGPGGLLHFDVSLVSFR